MHRSLEDNGFPPFERIFSPRFESWVSPRKGVFKYQRSSNWCWAAVVEMTLSYYGFQVSQEQVVDEVFGFLPDWPAGFDEIDRSINEQIIMGRSRYHIAGERIQSASELITELNENHPVPLVYGAASGAASHAVLLIGMKYEQCILGPRIYEYTVLDPSPLNEPITKHNASFGRFIEAAWSVHISKIKVAGALTPTTLLV